MYRDADERLAELREQNEIAGAMFKMKEDPRVTKIGKFIRKHSIDEFPQFLNVFLGPDERRWPRPPLPNEVAEYTEYDLQRASSEAVSRDSGRLRSETPPWSAVIRVHIAKRGIVMDLKIVLLTVLEVSTGSDAY